MDATNIISVAVAALSIAAAAFTVLRQRRIFNRRLEAIRMQNSEYPLTSGYDGVSLADGNDRLLEDAAASGGVFERFLLLMESEKLYLNSEVRITDIAERIFTTEASLSKAIKLKTGKNFCQYINYLRVREAMRIYTSQPDAPISTLREMVGFNSPTTFNTAFSRNTGYTPAEWCRDFHRRNGSNVPKRSN